MLVLSNNGKINSNIKLHPNPKIDVAVINVTELFNQFNLNTTVIIDSSKLLPLDEALTHYSYGSPIFTIGFPGVSILKTNQPIVKAGIVASSLSGNLTVKNRG